ncbi:hypothetical protein ACFWP0_09325 [Achromobacter sp. NPDC058515]|uniref:hypothetical protein n=1 Tax=Achromobacter sp. NPDC058515 TaxID=3346533 RepID=UPI00364C8A50
MSKTINDLRDAMFETMTALKEGKITIEQAKAVSEIGQVIINSAKVEVDYIRANNGGESSFIDAVGNDNLPPGITGVTRHRLVG